MRTITLSIVILFCCLVGSAQTPDEFKQKYGPPDEQGRYIVRPGIAMTVKYTSDQRLSDILLQPDPIYKPRLPGVSNSNAMPEDIAQQVLDELVPLEKRGTASKFLANIESSCISISPRDYEFVTIGITRRCNEQGGGLYQISVHWKNK